MSTTLTDDVPHSEYASATRRVCAALLDAFILWIGTLPIILLLDLFFMGHAARVVGYVATILVYIVYYTLTESSTRRASIGKRFFAIQVERVDGGRMDGWTALARAEAYVLVTYPLDYMYFRTYAEPVSLISIWLLIPAIILVPQLYTRKRQCLHDFITKTVVVHRVDASDPIRRLSPLHTAVTISGIFLVCSISRMLVPVHRSNNADEDTEMMGSIQSAVIANFVLLSFVIFALAWIIKRRNIRFANVNIESPENLQGEETVELSIPGGDLSSRTIELENVNAELLSVISETGFAWIVGNNCQLVIHPRKDTVGLQIGLRCSAANLESSSLIAIADMAIKHLAFSNYTRGEVSTLNKVQWIELDIFNITESELIDLVRIILARLLELTNEEIVLFVYR